MRNVMGQMVLTPDEKIVLGKRLADLMALTNNPKRVYISHSVSRLEHCYDSGFDTTTVVAVTQIPSEGMNQH